MKATLSRACAALAILAACPAGAPAQNPPVNAPIIPAATPPYGTPAFTYYANFHNDYITRSVNPNVVFLGDSITDRWGETPFGNYSKYNDNNPSYNGIASTHQPVWTSRIAQYRAFNFGISGDQAQNVLWRVLPNPPSPGELDPPRNPRVAVLMIGINNINAGSPTDQIASTIQGITYQIHARSPGTRVLVMGVLPVATPSASVLLNDGPRRDLNNKLNSTLYPAYNARPAGARGYGSGDYFLDISSSFLYGSGLNQNYYDTDMVGPPGMQVPVYIHPSNYGYQIWASAIATPLRQMLRKVAVPNDFDGDGRSDVGVFQRSTGKWYILFSGLNGQGNIYTWGSPTAIPAPADYDGDGLVDIAAFEPNYASYNIAYSNTLANPTVTGSFPNYPRGLAVPFGNTATIPIGADYDGDGKADVAGFVSASAAYGINYTAGGAVLTPYGNAASAYVPGDYDGDGLVDIALLDRAAGVYYVRGSAVGDYSFPWGNAYMLPATGDYNGDGRDDYAGFDPISLNYFIDLSSGGHSAYPCGTITCTAVPGDYDGDGKTDRAIYNAANSNWTIWYSTNPNSPSTFQFGYGGNDWIALNASPFSRAQSAAQ